MCVVHAYLHLRFSKKFKMLLKVVISFRKICAEDLKLSSLFKRRFEPHDRNNVGDSTSHGLLSL